MISSADFGPIQPFSVIAANKIADNSLREAGTQLIRPGRTVQAGTRNGVVHGKVMPERPRDCDQVILSDMTAFGAARLATPYSYKRGATH